MNAICTQLSFSAGTGSGDIIERVLRGEIERPENFVVIRAHPGMENGSSNTYARDVHARCLTAGIPYIETGRNLFQAILAIKRSGRTRFDMPPWWTRNRETGSKGRLKQKCTKWCKIGPMDSAMRRWMHVNLGVSMTSKRIGTGICRKWIGFSHDEWHRIKEDKRKYIVIDYPLVNLKITKAGIVGDYLRWGKPLPSRSLCNACFANDVAMFKEMHDNRPDEFWGEAVPVDEAIRDLRCIGVNDECFVSSTLIPLRELAAMNFILPPKVREEADEKCHSGHCFV